MLLIKPVKLPGHKGAALKWQPKPEVLISMCPLKMVLVFATMWHSRCKMNTLKAIAIVLLGLSIPSFGAANALVF